MADPPPHAPSRPPFGRGPHAARVLRGVIRASAWAGGRLPVEVVARLAAAGGTLEWAARPRKRRILAANLAHALGLPAHDPRVHRAVREEVVWEARRSADFLWSVAFPDRVAAATRVEGADGLERALAGGRGAILAGPHAGGWEVVTPLAARAGVEVTALVEDDWLAWAVAGIRAGAGLRLVPVGTPPHELVSALRRGGIVAVLADQPKPWMRTVEVALFGDRVALPSGPATLARLTGAPLVPFAVLPIAPRAWRVVLGRPLDPPPRAAGGQGDRQLTQALADVWTDVLAAHPTLWAAVDPMPWRAGA
jgi:phosphatidylinositol dimannoside acyltransferase